MPRGPVAPARVQSAQGSGLEGAEARGPRPEARGGDRIERRGRGPGGACARAPLVVRGATFAAPLRYLCAVSLQMLAACRRHAMCEWASRVSLNRPIRRYHPRSQLTTLLHIAVAEGMEKVALLLIERGSRLDAKDSTGRTPMDEARERAQRSLATLLHLAQIEAARREGNDSAGAASGSVSGLAALALYDA